MRLNSLIAYRVSDYYSFERPDDPEAEPVLIRPVAGAWISQSRSGAPVICSPAYAFGAGLMTAIQLGLCSVEAVDGN